MSLQNQAQKTGSRFKFIKQLAEELTRPHMKRRENNEHTPRDIKTSIRQILKIADELPTVSGPDYLETHESREVAIYEKMPPPNVVPKDLNKCGGLLSTLKLAEESRVILRQNISVSDGFVNEAMGIVK
ncbi:hypothetical protein EVAR_87155_1 [Eumeta japonica]|uniref:Uncharacterized protein n=1 Tax=Eumeta variegata TaxID=151549 RepID=A0A4C1VXF2_EUMVA|nr:hypothetical protein EVAR_87155_1 [Eumeta japonica]